MSTKNNDTEFDDGKPEYESPLLNKLKESPVIFKEPEGYFDSLRNEILTKILQEEDEERMIIGAYKRGIVRRIFQPRYAVAATLMFAAVMTGWHYYNKWKPLPTLSQQEIAEIITVEKIHNIDEDVLIEAIEIEALNEIETLNEEEISNDVIIDYLLENDVDLELLNEI